MGQKVFLGVLQFPLNQVDQTLLAGQTTKQEAVILGLEDQNIRKPLLKTLSFIQAYNVLWIAKLTSRSFHQDGVISVKDIDLVMSEGLGMRYAFIGPIETMHLNAPEGKLPINPCNLFKIGIMNLCI